MRMDFHGYCCHQWAWHQTQKLLLCSTLDKYKLYPWQSRIFNRLLDEMQPRAKSTSMYSKDVQNRCWKSYECTVTGRQNSAQRMDVCYGEFEWFSSRVCNRKSCSHFMQTILVSLRWRQPLAATSGGGDWTRTLKEWERHVIDSKPISPICQPHCSTHGFGHIYCGGA